MELAVGRIVHVKNEREECRPAIVVHVWNATCFNGVLFRDGTNDDGDGFGSDGGLTSWVTSVVAGSRAHEWHDPRTCEAVTA